MADSGDLALEKILKWLSDVLGLGKQICFPSSTASPLSLSGWMAFHSSAGSPGLVSLNAHIGQALSCLSSFLKRPLPMCTL